MSFARYIIYVYMEVLRFLIPFLNLQYSLSQLLDFAGEVSKTGLEEV